MTEAPNAETPAGCTIPGSLCFDLAPARGGDAYRVFVSPPQGEMPPQGWPILYLADGNACFPIAAASHAIQSPYSGATNVGPGIIVGIGYPTDQPFDLVRRALDLTPPPGRTYPPYSAGGNELVTGGAETFLGFIENELKPRIAALFQVDMARQTFFGHSFGGLFSLYALFTKPTSFSRYIAASPSIFWEDANILDLESRCSATPGVAKRQLHLSAGEYEADRLAPFQIGADDAASRLEGLRTARTAANAKEMAHRLGAAHPSILDVCFETFAGETHMTVLPASIGRALQIAFAYADLQRIP